MPINELLTVLNWWGVIFIIGISILPLTSKIFSNFFDRGYIFSKILGLGILSYAVFILGLFHILQFSRISIILVLILVFSANLFFIKSQKELLKKTLKISILEELIFLLALFVWSFIRGTNPDIHGLEKFMDFGFINSILRSEYFPPKDMWFPPDSINYYYFGHLIIAVLTKLSDIKASVTFNLSVATIFAFTLAGTFSLGTNLIYLLRKAGSRGNISIIISGLITASFVTLGGNLQPIYAFFVPQSGESSLPFWNLIFSPSTFPNAYWYPNATRFIYHTIHEFPIYSFVVSDLHAHVLSLPFVIFIIAALFSIFVSKKLDKYSLLLISFILGILYMANTWDTVTYFFLTSLIVLYIQWKNKTLEKAFINLVIIAISTFIFILPFSNTFKPFTQGVGIICAPQFLLNIGKLGPLIFEPNHCMRSPVWQLLILYGFFAFWVSAFALFIKREKMKILKDTDIFIILLIITSIALIILPEFVYIKDIYTAHYRANTMFKFVYQAFIMLSISSAYIVVRIILKIKEIKKIYFENLIIFIIGIPLIFLVFSYPVFAINSYYNGAKNYLGLDGQTYLKTLYPDDFVSINWLNKNIKGQPIILEAQGDSYTDYERISANTGLPTILGWTVHEWLWRGTYDVTVPRITDVKTIYETTDLSLTKSLLKKYDVSYVYVGDTERTKYPNLNEEKFIILGKIIFASGTTKIYKINY